MCHQTEDPHIRRKFENMIHECTMAINCNNGHENMMTIITLWHVIMKICRHNKGMTVAEVVSSSKLPPKKIYTTIYKKATGNYNKISNHPKKKEKRSSFYAEESSDGQTLAIVRFGELGHRKIDRQPLKSMIHGNRLQNRYRSDDLSNSTHRTTPRC